MHRGVGLAAFDRQTQSLQSYAALSSTLSQTHLTSLHSQLAQFRTALTRFASSHRDEIRKDPAFRRAFQQMCSEIGVDPLAGPRKGGWWAEFLPDLSDWTYELGVQIVDVCKMVRSVVKELDEDQAVALSVAQALGGFIDVSALVEAQGWTRERAETALENMLLRDGLCWIDEQDEGGVSYWVPSAMEWSD
ncbi:hypothetical protein FRB97_007626 [Tulasnella sp. 331]|nr:hypothetical protein FRB97_007626 [Tulasnella sp. 331]